MEILHGLTFSEKLKVAVGHYCVQPPLMCLTRVAYVQPTVGPLLPTAVSIPATWASPGEDG